MFILVNKHEQGQNLIMFRPKFQQHFLNYNLLVQSYLLD